MCPPDRGNSSQLFLWSPAALLEGVLEIADRQAKRRQAKERIGMACIQELSSMPWTEVLQLTTYVLAALGTKVEEQTEIARDIKALQKNVDGLADWRRNELLGLSIVELAGPGVLDAAVASWKARKNGERPKAGELDPSKVAEDTQPGKTQGKVNAKDQQPAD
jgi:hypothetical protein